MIQKSYINIKIYRLFIRISYFSSVAYLKNFNSIEKMFNETPKSILIDSFVNIILYFHNNYQSFSYTVEKNILLCQKYNLYLFLIKYSKKSNYS